MSAPATINLRVQQGGRIIIPAWARKQLDLRIGTSVVLNVQADRATLTSPRARATQGVPTSAALRAQQSKSQR